MADPAPTRVEPSIGPAPVPTKAGEETRASADAAPAAGGGAAAPMSRVAIDQLSRIEDKAARIEEKYARSEALLQRVESTLEAADNRMQQVATQAELATLRTEVSAMAAQVRRLPGKTALIAVAVVTSLLTAAIVLALFRYGMPGAMPR